MLYLAFVFDCSETALQIYAFFPTLPNLLATFLPHSCILNSNGVIPVRRLKYLLKKVGLGKSRPSEI